MRFDKIALMCPTYGRTETYLPTFIKSAIDTCIDKECLIFIFCVNRNDTSKQFLKEYDFGDIPCIIVEESLPSPNLAMYFNAMYAKVRECYGPNVIVSMLGDDMVFETPGWDREMLKDINHYNGVGVFWCNDDYIAHERCAVNLFVTQRMVEATEHPFMCEEFEADYIDVVWTRVGKYTRTSHYRPDIIIRHNHSSRNPREQWDSTYQRLNKAQVSARETVGKQRAKDVGWEIAEVLKRKGMIGDSIC